MNFEDMLIYLIPLTVFSGAAIAAFFMGKAQSRSALVAGGGLWAAFTALMFFGMHEASGWDGLGYFLALAGISAPVGAGLIIGGPLGWMKKVKALDA